MTAEASPSSEERYNIMERYVKKMIDIARETENTAWNEIILEYRKNRMFRYYVNTHFAYNEFSPEQHTDQFMRDELPIELGLGLKKIQHKHGN